MEQEIVRKAKLWERRKGETEKAFEAFRAYRDMGDKRSLTNVAKLLGKSITIMERWSKQHDWVERATAYDNWIDDIALRQVQKSIEKREQDRLDMVDRHSKIVMIIQKKVVDRLNSLTPGDLNADNVIKYLDTAVKIERLSRGVPTEISANELTGKDGRPIEMKGNILDGLTIEELRSIAYAAKPDTES